MQCFDLPKAVAAADDPRGARLRAFDAQCRDFALDAARGSLEAAATEADIGRLAALAGSLAAAATDWRRAVAALDLAREAEISAPRAARLVAETVFDEVLTPAACRVLVSALALAGDEP